MLGAIIGDIVGSRFEFQEHSGKDFPLFVSECRPTDDTFMTIAVARALLLAKGDYTDLGRLATWSMKDIAAAHPNTGWGERFYKKNQVDWLLNPVNKSMEVNVANTIVINGDAVV